ncbi:MAG: hypothetical protein HOJ35_01710 [Bdellovibrionales bacterium]|nr:hypothetical protein [Bdellovibrionales bacterium]
MSKKIKSKINFYDYFLIIMLFIFTSCVEQGNGTRFNQSTESASTATTQSLDNPSFSGSVTNYIQKGTVQSFNTTILEHDFKDSIYIRGQMVHEFFQGYTDVRYACLLAHFKDIGGTQKMMVLTANVQSMINYSTNSKEYFVVIEPNNKNLNDTYCKTTGVLDYVTNFESEISENVYSIDTLCTNCINNSLISEGLVMITSDGNTLQNVNLTYLNLSINTDLSYTETKSSCSSQLDCTKIGFDCCASGQCVNDLTLKNQVDKTSEYYIQASHDIIYNPSHIYNYPDLYNICPTNIVNDSSEVSDFNPYSEEEQRFIALKELYECSTLVDGEMSLCTVSYENASLQLEPFYTKEDDRTFESTYSGNVDIEEHSIYKIVHAGVTLYESGTALHQENFGIGDTLGEIKKGNDNLDDKLLITLDNTPDASAPDDTLKIQYRIDGSCTEINVNLAKCEKHYTQGQNEGRTTDHYPASNKFKLPLYADFTRSINVYKDNIKQVIDVDWELTIGSPSEIKFIGTSLQVMDTQKVQIQFYVDLETNNVLNSKKEALNKIDEICQCGGPYCTLQEEYNSTGSEVIDYNCVYPQPVTVPGPMEVSILMNSKSIPRRYFDSQGISHSEILIDTPEQESSNTDGLAFEYIDDNLLKPNNLENYIGFDEIYGTISFETSAAKPPAEIDLVDGKTYDIFVNSGTYSSCFYCGNDYYTHIAKIFPKNLTHRGGGYRPDASETSRTDTDYYRADDLIFGRACFLPATMIAWTHKYNDDIIDQRKKRLSAQHFLFANGYQRDWYGFDYGAIIGSFDGVTWFAIGNQRRIKSTSSKLFIAINTYFADLTSQDSFNITVSDATLALGAGSQITDDNESDGAECRQYHQCEIDTDCVAQLGWDYTCENINNFKSYWPDFDNNAFELPSNEDGGKTLFNRFLQGETSGKRCVYRGMGAPCIVNYTNTTNSYNDSDEIGSLACAPNYYCQDISNGISTTKFNNRITRYGKSALMQNASEDVADDEEHTFGRSTRIIGRPYNYIGDEAIESSSVISNLTHNDVEGICLPGKDLSQPTYQDQNSSDPDNVDGEKFDGDRVLGIGMTLSQAAAEQDKYDQELYLTSCGIFDYEGNYIYKDSTKATTALMDLTVDDGDDESNSIVNQALSQVTSTNALKVFNNYYLGGLEIIKDFYEEQVETITLQENRCLRLPGSVCHTNLDCAASKYITDLTQDIDVENSHFDGVDDGGINSYEIKFWQETMVCSQKYKPDHEDYDLKLNHCCRETGNTISLGQTIYDPDDGSSNFDYSPEDPKLTSSELLFKDIIDLNEPTRYSRLSVYANEIENGLPPLKYPTEDTCAGIGCMDTNDLEEQYLSLQASMSKMCCTNHWVRNFHDDNGGGHKFLPEKTQVISMDSFHCLNWHDYDDNTQPNIIDDLLTCENQESVNDSDCGIKDYVSTAGQKEAFKYLNFLGSLELTGIPQVAISSNKVDGNDEHPDPTCNINIADQTSVSGVTDNYIPGTLVSVSSVDNVTEIDDTENSIRYYSAGDMNNFETEEGIKEIFSHDTFSCCKEAGAEVEDGEGNGEETCCSGTAFNIRGTLTCALKSYTNISVYTNLYVSSALSGIDLGDNVDKKTGFVDPEYLKSLACNLRLCKSGAIARGFVLSALSIPGHEDKADRVVRFSTSEDDGAGGTYYDAGPRWNSHLYCVPPSASIFAKIPEAEYIECAY